MILQRISSPNTCLDPNPSRWGTGQLPRITAIRLSKSLNLILRNGNRFIYEKFRYVVCRYLCVDSRIEMYAIAVWVQLQFTFFSHFFSFFFFGDRSFGIRFVNFISFWTFASNLWKLILPSSIRWMFSFFSLCLPLPLSLFFTTTLLSPLVHSISDHKIVCQLLHQCWETARDCF